MGRLSTDVTTLRRDRRWVIDLFARPARVLVREGNTERNRTPADRSVRRNRSKSFTSPGRVSGPCDADVARVARVRFPSLPSGAVMPTEPTEKPIESTPSLTTEQAEDLVREGEAEARAYRERVQRMWALSRDARQTRAR